MGAGPRYPYPKQVWSPTGGWWSRPTNWAGNTLVCGVGIGIATYAVWMYSAEKEVSKQEASIMADVAVATRIQA